MRAPGGRGTVCLRSVEVCATLGRGGGKPCVVWRLCAGGKVMVCAGMLSVRRPCAGK